MCIPELGSLVTPTVESSQTYLLNDLEGILLGWLNDIFQMEGLYRIRKTSKNEIDNSLNRLKEDRLITEQVFNDLSYVKLMFSFTRVNYDAYTISKEE